ncbi:MAG TPA: hypothetical protein VKE69_12005, partial [Planctomycetota bacterium]|nr:hypothetical protein [Planctomycetota bacterium]
MRKTSAASFLPAALALLLIATSTRTAAANDTIPANGTPISLIAGGTKVVVVVGFGGCTFEVNGMSSDMAVATVAANSPSATKHNMVITAAGVGTCVITLTTANGSVPGCQGFVFTFPITVTPNLKGALLQAKSKISAAAKDLKADLADIQSDLDDSYDAIGESLELGAITVDEAIDLGL